MGVGEERLALFERRGVPLVPRVVRDRTGRELYLAERGEGPPVVLVHGGGAELGMWLPLVEHLGEEHRWILVDRHGHGLSGPIDYRGSDFRGLAAAFLEDVLDALALERPALLGNSMGGYFCLCFALAHPERVRELVLVGAPAGLDRWIPWPLRLMGIPAIHRALAWWGGPMDGEALRKQVFGMLVAHPDRIPADLLEVAAKLGAQPHAALAWQTLLARVLDLGGFRPELMIRDEVASLPVRTRFVWGERDAFAPPSSGLSLAERMPDAGVEVVTGAGHLPWLDAPEVVARAVLDGALARRAAEAG